MALYVHSGARGVTSRARYAFSVSVPGWPEPTNMKSKLSTLQTFQTLTSLTKAIVPSNINAMLVTLETSQLPISWLKSVTSLR